MNIQKLKLELIKIDGGTQARASLSQTIVEEYANHMRDGDLFPPVTVFHDGSVYWLADGFHRYFANKSHGSLEIDCDVKTGTLDDAKLYSFSANARRGLSMSYEDNRNIIKQMLEHPEWSQWTNAHIAKHIGVSAMTVGRIRKDLSPEQPAEKKYINKHGQESTIDTSKMATKAPKLEVVEEPQEDPVNELTDLVQQLEKENNILKDKIAVGQWDATEIEKIDVEDLIAELREKIRVLEIDNEALRKSRDHYQRENAELIKTVKSLQGKLKKAA